MESDFARRVRERLNSEFNWDAPPRIRSRHKPGLDPVPEELRQLAPQPVGVVGRLTPSKHEQALLRRLALPGSFVMVTLRAEKLPLYVFENGKAVLGVDGLPLTPRAFDRLCKFLVAEGRESLLADGPPQRWRARRPPPQ